VELEKTRDIKAQHAMHRYNYLRSGLQSAVPRLQDNHSK